MLESLPIMFFIVIAFSLISSIFLFFSKVSLNYVRFHIGVISLPPIIALFALIFQKNPMIWGPWHFNSLSWLLAVFVLTMGLIVQRFSVHYLLGDRHYRKYFSLLTLTTVAGSLAWLSDDLRLLLICWGVTLLGLTLIIRLKKEWQVAKHAAYYMGILFTISWLLLLFAILWVSGANRTLAIVTSDDSRSIIRNRVVGKNLYPTAVDLFCRDSGRAMAFPTLVIRLGSRSNSCFGCHACRDCERWRDHLNSFCATI